MDKLLFTKRSDNVYYCNCIQWRKIESKTWLIDYLAYDKSSADNTSASNYNIPLWIKSTDFFNHIFDLLLSRDHCGYQKNTRTSKKKRYCNQRKDTVAAYHTAKKKSQSDHNKQKASSLKQKYISNFHYLKNPYIFLLYSHRLGKLV